LSCGNGLSLFFINFAVIAAFGNGRPSLLRLGADDMRKDLSDRCGLFAAVVVSS